MRFLLLLLIPLLLETSFQAQVLIPMATSLCFGLLTATGLVLVLVPAFYHIYGSMFLGRYREAIDAEPEVPLESEHDDPVDEPGDAVTV